jgi:hypothetical protein
MHIVTHTDTDTRHRHRHRHRHTQTHAHRLTKKTAQLQAKHPNVNTAASKQGAQLLTAANMQAKAIAQLQIKGWWLGLKERREGRWEGVAGSPEKTGKAGGVRGIYGDPGRGVPYRSRIGVNGEAGGKRAAGACSLLLPCLSVCETNFRDEMSTSCL